VHISEVADAYVHEVSDYVKHNDRIKVKVLSISEGGEKIGLSLRQANPGPPEFITPDEDGKSNEPVEDKIKRFMKESEEKLNEMRRNRNNRRGGRDPR